MELLLGAVGMLVCLAIMAVMMPLGMRVARRIRRGPTTHTPGQHGIQLAGPVRPPMKPGSRALTARAGGRRGQERG